MIVKGSKNDSAKALVMGVYFLTVNLLNIFLNPEKNKYIAKKTITIIKLLSLLFFFKNSNCVISFLGLEKQNKIKIDATKSIMPSIIIKFININIINIK